MSIIHKYKEITKVSRRNKITKPWITPGLLRCIRNRDLMHLKLKHEPDNIILKTTYLRYRNFCNALLKKIKIDYEKRLFEMAKNNPKEQWKVIHSVTSSRQSKKPPQELLQLTTDSRSSINKVNEYFVNIGSDLAQKISPPSSSLQTNSLPQFHDISNSFVILPLSETEVENIILSLRTVSATGWDDI
jgi:hypothetical protein